MRIHPFASLCPAAGLLAAVMSGCAPDGLTEFRAGHVALQKTDRLTMTWITKSAVGVVTDKEELDCSDTYYHHVTTTDLSPEGVLQGRTIGQGLPRAHQESEELIVDGQSYNRNTSNWENPSADNARPWVHPSTSYDAAGDCDRLHQGQDSVLVPLKKIVATNQITYLGSQTVDGVSCHEYQVTYPDVVYSDKMKTTDLGGGRTYSEAQTTTKPVQATVCLAASDDHRPLRSIKSDVTTTFSYGPIVRLAAPALGSGRP